jgi:uncharacterized membrane protein
MEFLFSLKFLKIAIPSILMVAFLDYIFLGLIASKFYTEQLGYLAELKKGKIVFNIPMGVIAQAGVALSFCVFILTALQLNNTLGTSVACGAIMALLVFTVYDFTNLSFVKGYPLKLALVDIGWGTVQGLAAGVYVYYFNKWF